MKQSSWIAIGSLALCLGCDHHASPRPAAQSSGALAAAPTVAPAATSATPTPAPVPRVASAPGPSSPFKASRLLGRACALDESGLAYCWGNPTAVLADRSGDAVPRRTPELDRARAFAKSAFFSYFLDDTGHVYIWGTGRHSYLGDVTRPKPLPRLERVQALAAFDQLVHALRADGSLLGWNDSFVSEEPGEPGTVVSNPPTVEAIDAIALAPPANTHYLARDATAHRRDASNHPVVANVGKLRSMTDCPALSCGLDDAGRSHCWTPHTQEPFGLAAPGPLAALGCGSGGRMFALTTDGNVFVQIDPFSPTTLVHISTLRDVEGLALCDGTLACPHCLKLKSGVLSCWAEGSDRQLGSGTWPSAPNLVPLQKGRDVTTPRAK